MQYKNNVSFYNIKRTVILSRTSVRGVVAGVPTPTSHSHKLYFSFFIVSWVQKCAHLPVGEWADGASSPRRAGMLRMSSAAARSRPPPCPLPSLPLVGKWIHASLLLRSAWVNASFVGLPLGAGCLFACRSGKGKMQICQRTAERVN